MDKTRLGTVIGGVAAAALASALVSSSMKTCNNGSGRFEEALVKMSSELNSKLPIMIDSATRLDATVPGPGNRLSYLYTLTAFSAGEVDTNALRAQLTPQIMNSYRTMPEMRDMWEHGTELDYVYRDTTGKHILTIVSQPD